MASRIDILRGNLEEGFFIDPDVRRREGLAGTTLAGPGGGRGSVGGRAPTVTTSGSGASLTGGDPSVLKRVAK